MAEISVDALPFSLDDPLGKITNESSRANAALRDYAYMGANRSLKRLHAHYVEQVELARKNGKIYSPPTTRYSTICTWSDKKMWVARVKVWEGVQQKLEEKKWEDRRGLIKERDYTAGDQLRELFDQIMAAAPAFVIETRKMIPAAPGMPAREEITKALDVKLMIQALETASKLQRASAGPVDTLTINNLTIPWEKLSKEELEAIAAGQDPMLIIANRLKYSNHGIGNRENVVESGDEQ